MRCDGGMKNDAQCTQDPARATLGKAHQWVRSITDTREYALENPDGERISLADLTNGSTKQVRVVGEVKKNPAHPAAFTGRSFGMNQHVNLTHILPEEVKPALVSSMVREQGLFGAVQSLSILLARPLKDFTPTSPMAEEILRSMFYDYKEAPCHSATQHLLASVVHTVGAFSGRDCCA